MLLLLLLLLLLKRIFMRGAVKAGREKAEAETGLEMMAIRIRAERTGAPAPVFPAGRAAVLPLQAGRKHKAKPRKAARCKVIFRRVTCRAVPVQ